jgi:cobalt-zinc-cadmium efflux system outer membrane protein
MQGRIVVSPQKRVERDIIRSRIALLEREVHKIGSDTKAAFTRLNLYTGLPDKDHYDVMVKWFSTAWSIDTAGMAAKAAEKGFTVRMLRKEAAVMAKEKELGEKGIYPDVDVSLYYNDEKIDTAERSIGGGVSFPLPVFSTNKNAVKRSVEKEKAARLELDYATREAAHMVKELAARYEYAAEMVKNFPVSDIDRLEKSMSYADSEFRKGRVALTTYLEMDASAHEMLEEIFLAQLDLVNLYTSLLFLAAEERPVSGDLPW